jgi:hypothetical protein
MAVDVFRSTWEAERPDLAQKGERDGRYRVYCVACDTLGDHPSGEAYFVRMPEGEVRYVCLRCVGGGSSRISSAFREQAECHRELMREYERNASAPISLPPPSAWPRGRNWKPGSPGGRGSARGSVFALFFSRALRPVAGVVFSHWTEAMRILASSFGTTRDDRAGVPQHPDPFPFFRVRIFRRFDDPGPLQRGLPVRSQGGFAFSTGPLVCGHKRPPNAPCPCVKLRTRRPPGPPIGAGFCRFSRRRELTLYSILGSSSPRRRAPPADAPNDTEPMVAGLFRARKPTRSRLCAHSVLRVCSVCLACRPARGQTLSVGRNRGRSRKIPRRGEQGVVIGVRISPHT